MLRATGITRRKTKAGAKANQKPKRKPAPVETIVDCQWRGEVVSSMGGCCGQPKRITIYACQLHGECTAGPDEPGVKACSTCADRMPLPLVAE